MASVNEIPAARVETIPLRQSLPRALRWPTQKSWATVRDAQRQPVVGVATGEALLVASVIPARRARVESLRDLSPSCCDRIAVQGQRYSASNAAQSDRVSMKAIRTSRARTRLEQLLTQRRNAGSCRLASGHEVCLLGVGVLRSCKVIGSQVQHYPRERANRLGQRLGSRGI